MANQVPKPANNALKHGVFSEMVILPGESIEDFEELHKSVIVEWQPEGPTQDDKVFSIAKNMWRKRRLPRFVKAKIAEYEKRIKLYDRFEQNRNDGLIEFLEYIESGGTITEDDLSIKLGKSFATQIKNKIPRKNYADNSAWQEAVAKAVSKLLEEVFADRVNRPKIQDDFSGETFLYRELDVEKSIDAKINKDVLELMRLKAFQEINNGGRRAPIVIPPNAAQLMQIDSPATKIVEDREDNRR